MGKSIRILILLLFTSFLAVEGAAAYPTKYIDFRMDSTHPPDASISYAGGIDDPLIGLNISVDSVQGYYNMSNPTTSLYTINNGSLSFETGNFTSYAADVWTFNDPNPGHNYIEIRGGITDLGISDDTILVSGTFTSARVMRQEGDIYSVIFGSFVDTKDATLVQALFGWVPPGFKGSLNLTFNANPLNGTGFQSGQEIFAGHVSNTPVPLPGSVWLLGAGILGFLGIRRKK